MRAPCPTTGHVFALLVGHVPPHSRRLVPLSLRQSHSSSTRRSFSCGRVSSSRRSVSRRHPCSAWWDASCAAAEHRFGEDRGESFEGDLTIAELRTFLLRGDREHAVDESIGQALEGSRSLRQAEGGGRREVEAELHPRVRGVDRLTAGAGGTTEAPAELLLGHDDRTRDAERTDHGADPTGWERCFRSLRRPPDHHPPRRCPRAVSLSGAPRGRPRPVCPRPRRRPRPALR